MNLSDLPPIDYDTLRIPPHSMEAECGLLGSLLLDNSAWDRVGDLLVASDLYRSEHQLIFGELSALINAGKPADVLTVFESLQRSGKDDSVGGLAYLNSLAQYVASAANIRRYAELIRERSILRQLVKVGGEISASGFEAKGLPVKQVLDTAEQKIMAIGESHGKSQQGFQGMDSIVVRVLDRITELAENPGSGNGLMTGFHDLDRLTSGFQPGDLVILAARPGMGKAQPLDAKVLCANGQWSLMGSLKTGDRLASVDGQESVVNGIHPQGSKRVNRVTFSDGRSTECCAEHLWSVNHRQWLQPKILSTQDVVDLLKKPSMKKRLWVERISGVFGSAEKLPVDPWVLGALLGDGDLTQRTIRFSKTAEQTLNQLKVRLPQTVELIHASGCDWRLSVPDYQRGQKDSNPLTVALKSLGLMGTNSATKFIPAVYMTADRSARLDLMRGLLDTDGWVEKHGTVRFGTVSMQLALGVQALARSLGYWCNLRTRTPKYTYLDQTLDGQLFYQLCISGKTTDELFLLDDKRERCITQSLTQRVSFVSIVEAGEAECQCIEVSHPSRLYVTDDYIVTHNTALALNIAQHVAVTDGKPVAVFSMEMGAEQLGVRLIGALGRIDQTHMRTGELSDAEWPRLAEAVERLRSVPLYIEDSAGLTINDLRSSARRLARQCGGQLGLILVDYLQLMTVSSSMEKENRATAVGELSRGLKLLAKELNCPIIALSQLSRGVESRADKRPMMSDLRESGALEQDADTILFIYNDQYYTKEACKEPGIAELIIGKQRSGPTGTVKLAWSPQLTTFSPLAGGY